VEYKTTWIFNEITVNTLHTHTHTHTHTFKHFYMYIHIILYTLTYVCHDVSPAMHPNDAWCAQGTPEEIKLWQPPCVSCVQTNDYSVGTSNIILYTIIILRIRVYIIITIYNVSIRTLSILSAYLHILLLLGK